MPPKKKKSSSSNASAAAAQAKFTPTPPQAQPSSSMSYLNALSKRNEEKAQPPSHPSPAPAPAPAPAAQQKAAVAPAPVQPPQQQQQQHKAPAPPQESTAPAVLSYKSILQKPAPAEPPAPARAVGESKEQQQQQVVVMTAAAAAAKEEMSGAAKSPSGSGDVSATSVQQQSVAGKQYKVPPQKQKYKFSEKLSIPMGAAAYIIGKGGANVKRVNETSGAFATVKDNYVSIQANSKQHIGNARRQVLELLRSYMSRVSTQAREFNVYMHNDIDVPNMKVVMNPHEGPYSEWTIRDALYKEPVSQHKKDSSDAKPVECPKQESELPKQEAVAANQEAHPHPQETAKQETLPQEQQEQQQQQQDTAVKQETPKEEEKPIFYTPTFEAAQSEEEEEDDEEEELKRMIQYTSGKREVREKKESSEKQLQGASFNLIDKQLLKDMFGLITEKLMEEKEREEQFRHSFSQDIEIEQESQKTPEEIAKAVAEKKKEYHKNSADAEVILGKKLFFINPEKKKKKKEKDIDVVEDVPLASFIENRFGYSHKYHMTFNYALNADYVKKIESSLMEKENIKISKRQVLLCRTYLEGHKKANILLEVEPSESNLAPVKIVEYHEKSQRIAFVDFVRPILNTLDYRIIAKYYSHIDAPAKLVENVTQRVCFDKTKNEFVIKEEQQQQQPNQPDALEKKANVETGNKKAEEKKERLNLILDRIKNETLYTDGKFTAIISSVRDKVQKTEDEKREAVASEGDSPHQEKKFLETMEIVVRCSGLDYEGIEQEKQVNKDIFTTMDWVSTLLENVGL